MKKILAIIFIVVFFSTLLAATLRGERGNFGDPASLWGSTAATKAFESSHERATYAFMLSVLKDKSLALSKAYADFGAPDIGFFKGKFYSFFPPGMSAAIAPLYLAGEAFNLAQVFAYATSALFSIFAAIFLFLIGRHVFKLSIAASILIPVIFVFSTTAWSYSVTIYQHSATAFFMVSTFYFVWKYKENPATGWIWAILAWVNYALSMFFDYPNAVLLLPIMFYFLFSSFSVVKEGGKTMLNMRLGIYFTFIFFVAIFGAHLYYNQLALGHWSKFSNTLPRYHADNYEQLMSDLDSKGTNKATDVAAIFTESNIVNGFYTLSAATDKGMFYYSPVLLLGILGMFSLRRKFNKEVATLSFLVFVNVLLYASFGDPWGGWAYGPRYLVPCMAILSIFAVIWISQARWIWARKFIALILIVYSSSVALLGALTTNLIPPKVEAVYLKIKYGLPMSIDYFQSGKSGSFMFNTYFSDTVTLQRYFIVLLSLVVLVSLLLLIFIPAKHDEN